MFQRRFILKPGLVIVCFVAWGNEPDTNKFTDHRDGMSMRVMGFEAFPFGRG